MGIKDLDVLAKTIKPFRQDVCEASALNRIEINSASSLSANLPESLSTENHLSNSQRQRQRRPDRAVYVPRGRRSQPSAAPTSNSGSVVKTQDLASESVDVIGSTNSTISPCQNTDTVEEKDHEPVIDTKKDMVHKDIKSNSIDHSILPVEVEKSQAPPSSPLTTAQNIETIPTMADTQFKCEGSKIENTLDATDKDYNEEKEFQRASKEINRRNRRIIKQTFDSNVLEINETTSVMSIQSSPDSESKLEKKSKLPHAERQSNANSTTQTKRIEKSEKKAVSAETDDWESIFDDDGECLDPKLMNEITSNVGKVSISKPKNDYKSYQEPVNLEEEEFPHVLEVSNFPVEFKTQDLMMIFSEYKDLGFDIKWVDDTHALVVFSSLKVAARALNTGHPFIKLKPLTQATAESKARAKKNALFLQPYKQRPETCAALARRLVTGALGVRLSTAREEREIERRVLKEAKERKLLAAKLKEEANDAWENM